jgi:hypothetical protein
MNCREEMEFLEYFMNVRTFCIWGQGKTFGMGKIYTVTIYLLGLLPLAGAPKSRGEKIKLIAPFQVDVSTIFRISSR